MAFHTRHSFLMLVVSAALLAGIPTSCRREDRNSDLADIKKSQQEILARLETLDRSVQQLRAATPVARPQIDPNRVYDIPVGRSATTGATNAKVTIVEFADYQCPFCAQTVPLMHQVLQAYPNDVRLVYKQFPLTTIHPNAMPASRAAVAAGKQSKFWEMHELLYQNSRQLTADKLRELAQQIGLDVARWEHDLDAPDVTAIIEQDKKDGRAADVTGTPTIFVNGKRAMTRSFDGLKAMIEPQLRG